MSIFIGLVVVLVIVVLMLYDAYLRYEQYNRETGHEDQQRYYDKYNRHKWNVCKLKLNKSLFKGKKK